MGFASWRDFYTSDLQSPWALLVAPAAMLAYLAWAGRRRDAGFDDARFIRLYAVAFCIETLVDPIATGPLTRALALPDAVATALMLLFVLLGDFRVFLLVCHLASPRRDLRRAAFVAGAWTLAVPFFAATSYVPLYVLIDDLDAQVLWLIYELGFVAVALLLRQRIARAHLGDSDERLRRALRSVTAYVAGYYALWAISDVLIVFGGLDAGWLLRVLPNQLYYAFYVPFVYLACFRGR